MSELDDAMERKTKKKTVNCLVVHEDVAVIILFNKPYKWKCVHGV